MSKKPTGSISEELEKPDTQPQTVSTDDDQVQETAEAERNEPLNAPEGGAADDQPQETVTAPKADDGAKPKSVQEVIEELANDRKPHASDKPNAEAEGTDGDEPADPDDKGEQAHDDAAKAKDHGDVHPALKDWPKELRKNTRGPVKQQLIKQYEEFEAAKPFIEIGENWDALVTQNNLGDDLDIMDQSQVAWGIQSQAAAMRAIKAVAAGTEPRAEDLQTLDKLEQGIIEVFKALGRKPKFVTETSTQAPVELSEKLLEAVDMGFISKEEAHLLAQSEADKVAAEKAKTEAKPPAPKPAAKPTTPAASRPSADDELATRKTQAAITALGVKPEEITGFFNAKILPLLDQHLRDLYPNTNHLQAFAALSMTARGEVTRDVIAKYKATQQQRVPPKTDSSERPLRAQQGRRNPGEKTHTAGPPGTGAVAATIQMLSSDR